MFPLTMIVSNTIYYSKCKLVKNRILFDRICVLVFWCFKNQMALLKKKSIVTGFTFFLPSCILYVPKRKTTMQYNFSWDSQGDGKMKIFFWCELFYIISECIESPFANTFQCSSVRVSILPSSLPGERLSAATWKDAHWGTSLQMQTLWQNICRTWNSKSPSKGKRYIIRSLLENSGELRTDT